MTTPVCRFGCGPAVGRFAFSKGCVCFPDDRVQDLCAQHACHSTPIGTMCLIQVHVPWPKLMGQWELCEQPHEGVS